MARPRRLSRAGHTGLQVEGTMRSPPGWRLEIALCLFAWPDASGEHSDDDVYLSTYAQVSRPLDKLRAGLLAPRPIFPQRHPPKPSLRDLSPSRQTNCLPTALPRRLFFSCSIHHQMEQEHDGRTLDLASSLHRCPSPMGGARDLPAPGHGLLNLNYGVRARKHRLGWNGLHQSFQDRGEPLQAAFQARAGQGQF